MVDHYSVWIAARLYVGFFRSIVEDV